ncbi:hypothetical protein CPB85DRAFT_246176 [Mucidula mucida]|nr:hypothetical protein CPB85DRAFT_246176 [Mucidula mucida]
MEQSTYPLLESPAMDETGSGSLQYNATGTGSSANLAHRTKHQTTQPLVGNVPVGLGDYGREFSDAMKTICTELVETGQSSVVSMIALKIRDTALVGPGVSVSWLTMKAEPTSGQLMQLSIERHKKEPPFQPAADVRVSFELLGTLDGRLRWPCSAVIFAALRYQLYVSRVTKLDWSRRRRIRRR